MNFWNIIVDCGSIMWVILACSVLAVGIFIGKWFQFHRAQVNVRELVSGLVNVLRRDGMIEALTLCDNTPGPVARILTAAIQAYQNEDDIQQAIDDAVLVELPRLESLLNVLGTIAKTAPLLGLLGTVYGMLETFNAMRNSMALIDLSGGISIALRTTMAGLVLAIPCLIAYNYLVARVETFCIEMEKASSEIIYFFDHKGDRKKHESAAK